MEEEQQNTRVLKNGAIYDMDKKRIVANPGGGTQAITSENYHQYAAARAAKRARLYAEGAQMAVIDPALVLQYGEDAHLVERARTLQTIATTPEAGKAAVLADQSLRKAQGYEDDPTDPAQVVDAVAGLVRELAVFAAQIVSDNSYYRKHGDPDAAGQAGQGRQDEISDGVVVGDG